METQNGCMDNMQCIPQIAMAQDAKSRLERKRQALVKELDEVDAALSLIRQMPMLVEAYAQVKAAMA